MKAKNEIYYVYFFREKRTGKVIYVGSSSRPMERIKEHMQCYEGRKKNNQEIYKYLKHNNLELLKDVEIVFAERVKEKHKALELESEYFFKYKETLLNQRPAEERNGSFNPKRRRVQCINDGMFFETITECAKYYKKGRTTMTKILSSKTNKQYTYVNGEKFYFKYVHGTCND